jgi:hypothetical protein
MFENKGMMYEWVIQDITWWETVICIDQQVLLWKWNIVGYDGLDMWLEW